MKAVYNHLEYLDPERIFHFSENIDDTLQINMYVQIYSEKFIEYQKEIFEDFMANFIEILREESLLYHEITLLVEENLQQLNEKLRNFSSKLRDMPSVQLKGYLQIIVDQGLITSMIGDTSLMIFRDEKVLYTLINDTEKNTQINFFSDIVEGDVQMGDVIVYSGTKIKDILNHQDFEELEQTLDKDGTKTMIDSFSETLSMRIAEKNIGFIASFTINLLSATPRTHSSKSYLSQIGSKIKTNQIGRSAKKFINANRYYSMIAIFAILIFFLVYIVSSQLGIINPQSIPYTTQSGQIINLTIDEIQKDLYNFKTLDPSSNEKSNKYHEILDKLSTLERNGKRLEDVELLKKGLEEAYNKGFRIINVSDLSYFDDPRNGIKTRTITFNNSEKNVIGTPKSIQVGEGTHIGGSKGGIVGAINETNRGSLVEFNMGSDVENCTLSLSTRGIFCYTNLGTIFNVTKAGVENMESAAGDWSTKDIGGLGTYGKTNFYVFQKNANNFASVFVTRYRNIPGSEKNYQVGQNYTFIQSTGMQIPQSFKGFAIDGNFLAWSDGKLYQVYRTTNSSSALDMREVELRGGDLVTFDYSNDLKIIASETSPYVYIFDKSNQTFTVYNSSPIKTHENYTKSFQLYYLFRFKFELGITKDGNRLTIIDAAVPADSGMTPDLYLLTAEGVNKVKLHEIIDRVKSEQNANNPEQ